MSELTKVVTTWIHRHDDWPNFNWNDGILKPRLDELNQSIRELLLIKNFVQELNTLHGFQHDPEVIFLTETVIKSSNIEGEFPDQEEVQKSIINRLKSRMSSKKIKSYETPGVWDDIVFMVMDACRDFDRPLTRGRMFEWHKAMFPDGYSSGNKINTGDWRDCPIIIGTQDEHGQVRKILYKGPDFTQVPGMMDDFIEWFNTDQPELNPFIKAGIAHLRFEFIHPFEDGNGRIGRALYDLLLAKTNARIYDSVEPFHNLSSRIEAEKDKYYQLFNKHAKNTLDITDWLDWFLGCLNRSVGEAREILESMQEKTTLLNWTQLKGINQRQQEVIYQMVGENLLENMDNATYREITGCESITASRDIADLKGKGIFIPGSRGGAKVNYRLITWKEVRASNASMIAEQFR